MGQLFGRNCFQATSVFIITILSIYGILGIIQNYSQTTKSRDVGDWPFNLLPLLKSYMLIQALFPFSGLFTFIAICKRSPLFFYGSGSVLLGAFTCCSVFGTEALRVTSKDITDEFFTTFMKNLNTSMKDWMNDIQWQHKCCGIYSFADWSHANMSDVPYSCCRRDDAVPSDICGVGVLSQATQVDYSTENIIYTNGCGSEISTMIKDQLFRLGVEIWIAGVVSLFVAIFFYVGVTRIYLRKSGNTVRCSENLANDDSDSNERNNNTSTSPNTQNAGLNRNSDLNNNPLQNSSRNSFSRKVEKVHFSKERQKWRKSQTSSVFNPNPRTRRMKAKVHTAAVYANNREPRPNVSASKSFILGDTHSNLMTAMMECRDTDPHRKHVDMLWYQSLEKNLSTVSTTPIDFSSMILPSILQSKKYHMGADLMSAVNEEEGLSQRNTLYTLVSERPFTPSLSQNCSLSLFNSNSLKAHNYDVCNGQISPPGAKLHRHSLVPSINLEEAAQKEKESDHTPGQQDAQHPTTSKPLEKSDYTPETIKEVDSFEILTAEQVSPTPVITPQPPISTGSTCPKYPNPTSSVRSSTLATIHEESESVKVSPVTTKVPSPAAGFMSPENVSPQQTQTKLCDSSEDIHEMETHANTNQSTFNNKTNNNNNCADNCTSSIESNAVVVASDTSTELQTIMNNTSCASPKIEPATVEISKMLWFRWGAVLAMILTIFISIALFLAIFIMCVNPANGRAMNADPYYNGCLVFYCAILLTELAMAATSIFGFVIAFRVWRNNHQLDHRLRHLFMIWLACLGITTVATFVLGILGLVRYRQPQEEIMSLYEIFTNYNQDIKFVGSFERYQRENSCCGINGPDDWMLAQLKSQGGGAGGGMGMGMDMNYMGSPSTGKCHLQPPTIPMGCGKKILEDIHYTMSVYCAVLILQTMFATAAGSLGWYCFFYWIEKEVIIIPEDEVSNIIVIEPESSTTTVDPTRSGSTLTSYTTDWSRSTILTRSGSRLTSFSKPPSSGLTQFSISGSGLNHLNTRNGNNGSIASPENFSDSSSFYPNSSRRIDSSRGTKMSNFSGANPSIGGPHSSSFRNKDEIASRNATNSVLNQSGVLPGVQQSAINDNIVKSILTGHIQSRIFNEQIKPTRPPSSHHRSYASSVHRSHHNNNNHYSDKSSRISSATGRSRDSSGIGTFSRDPSGSTYLSSGSHVTSMATGSTYLSSGSYLSSMETINEKPPKRPHSFNHMLHKQEKALGGRVIAEMHIDHSRDPDPENSEMDISHVKKGHRAHHATIAIIKNKHPKRTRKLVPGPEAGHGQTGHLAEDILEMSGGAAAAKSMIDDINLRVEHDPDGIEEGYVNKLHKQHKEKGGLDHPDADHPGHGQVRMDGGKLSAPSIDGSQAQSLMDNLMHPKPKPKRQVQPVIQPHEVNEEEDPANEKGHKHGSHHSHHSHRGHHGSGHSIGSRHSHHHHDGHHHDHGHHHHHHKSRSRNNNIAGSSGHSYNTRVLYKRSQYE